MLPADIPGPEALARLTDHRDAASVSVYLPSSPLPQDGGAVRLALRGAVSEAAQQLRRAGVSAQDADATLEPLRELDSDGAFWRHQSRSLALFAAPGVLETFRLANRVKEIVATGDRFDIGGLLRATTFANSGYVLRLSQGGAQLVAVHADVRPEEIPLEGLPDDLHTVLETTDTDGRFDRHRAQGSTGDRVPRERFSRIVQDAVLARIDGSGRPLILAATTELSPAYRAVNSYPLLLDQGIDVHPNALDVESTSAEARAILDEHYRRELSGWREGFGTQRSKGLATSSLAAVARAASAAAVQELLFDMDSALEGRLDESGAITVADDPAEGYGIVDEIAARVLKSGGRVRAVRNEDLLDGSPVAAILRYPLENLPG